MVLGKWEANMVGGYVWGEDNGCHGKEGQLASILQDKEHQGLRKKVRSICDFERDAEKG